MPPEFFRALTADHVAAFTPLTVGLLPPHVIAVSLSDMNENVHINKQFNLLICSDTHLTH